MRSSSPKGLIWVLEFLYLLLAATMMGIYAVSDFEASENQLEMFCRETKAGEPFTEVEARATDAGLVASRRKAAGPLGQALPV